MLLKIGLIVAAILIAFTAEDDCYQHQQYRYIWPEGQREMPISQDEKDYLPVLKSDWNCVESDEYCTYTINETGLFTVCGYGRFLSE